MPFAGMQTYLEMIVINKVSQRQISYDIIHIWNLFLKNYINKLIYRTETDSQSQKTNLWLPKGEWGC